MINMNILPTAPGRCRKSPGRSAKKRDKRPRRVYTGKEKIRKVMDVQIWKQEVQYIGSTSLHVSHDPAFGLRGPLPPHWHEEVELDYVLNGSLMYIINGVSMKVSAGEIAVVNSGVVHSGLELDDAPRPEVLAVLLDRKLFEPYLGEKLPVFKTFLLEAENEELREIMTELGVAYLRKEPYYELLLRANALRLCRCLLIRHRVREQEEAPPAAGAMWGIKTALRYIEEHCTEKLQLEDIAGVINYNPSYLSRRFHQVTGFTISEYLNRCRVKVARQLLRETYAPLSDIAFACGFPSVSSLITFFKRQYQTTPDRYRRLAQGERTEKVKNS